MHKFIFASIFLVACSSSAPPAQVIIVQDSASDSSSSVSSSITSSTVSTSVGAGGSDTATSTTISSSTSTVGSGGSGGSTNIDQCEQSYTAANDKIDDYNTLCANEVPVVYSDDNCTTDTVVSSCQYQCQQTYYTRQVSCNTQFNSCCMNDMNCQDPTLPTFDSSMCGDFDTCLNQYNQAQCNGMDTMYNNCLTLCGG